MSFFIKNMVIGYFIKRINVTALVHVDIHNKRK